MMAEVSFYWAAPLHDEEDRARTDEGVAILRQAGLKVYVPHEHGVWENMMKKLMAKGFVEAEATHMVKKQIYLENMEAMNEAEGLIFYVARAPSEGQLVELGYFLGKDKPIYIINEIGWPLNLMPEFASSAMYKDLADFVEDLPGV
jgi:nucleoside 2-deoxyribosyltransferase